MENSLESADRQNGGVWSTGLSIFAMFFGAGNLVYPLAVGRLTQDKSFFGVSGLIITAVLVPLLGLMAMLLYNGDYNAFFKRIGKAPGFLISLMILGLIGPFGGIPRCITISYSTLHAFGFEGVWGFNLMVFSLISCLVIFLFTYRPSRILSLLGFVLTPILLLSLAVIIAKGLIHAPSPELCPHTSLQMFTTGVLEGYNTMDLLAAFFFSSVVLLCLRKGGESSVSRSHLSVAFTGSLIAAALLASVYLCFSYIAASYSADLQGIAHQEMLGALALQLLGPYAGLIASIAVSFACLTTEIALTVVFAEFLHKAIFKEKISYLLSLVITLTLSFLVSTLRFDGITAFLVPFLLVLYPALIVLCIVNIFYKTRGFKPVKRLFYGVLILTIAQQMFS